ncbi:MAG: FtsQ-type POTRA domain-containing protein [Gammaproteobacteria bacterium]|nr:FtsQ-type POTRA domain-containing protein [Gammaproteobacteria bacterium]
MTHDYRHALDLGAGPQHEQMGDEPTPQWKSTVRSVLLFLGALVVPLGIIHAVDELYMPDNHLFTEVRINHQYGNRGQDLVREAVLSGLDGNFFSADIERLEEIVSDIPWISSVSIRRQWPSTLIVAIAEINPVVRWYDSEWITYSGEVLDIPPFLAPDEYAHLPMMSGPQGDEPELLDAFFSWSDKFGAWGLALDSFRVDEGRIWHFELSLGALSKSRFLSASEGETPAAAQATVKMEVDEENAGERIPRFVASLDRYLIDRFEEIRSIDLRYTNGFAIRWKNEQPSLALGNSHSLPGERHQPLKTIN